MLGTDHRDEDQKHEEEGRAEQRQAPRALPGIIEMPIITGMPSAIQASWR